MLSLPHSKTLLLLYSCSRSVAFKKAGQSFFPFLSHSCSCPVAFTRLDTPSFHSCPILVLAMSPSKGWTTLISILAPFLLSHYRLQTAGQPLFPFLPHSCSRSVTFKWLDNPYFHSCSIPALALSPSKGWTILLSIPVPFLFLPCHLQKAGQPIFPFLPHSCSCHVTFIMLDNPSFHSCSIPILALSPSQKAGQPFCFILALAPFPSQKAGQPFFQKFLFYSCSCPVAFTRLDTPSFHSCSILALALS